jgi:hypothetical protein
MELDRNDLISLVNILRRVTVLVKVSPFIYAGMLIISMILYFFECYGFAFVIDTLFHISVVTVVIFLLLSKSLKLCKWHRLECIIPLIAAFPTIIDEYFFTFSTMAAYSNVTIIILLSILSLINAYHVFIKPR